jgi:membrane protein implicated in regulation of membrane protease activity
MKSKRQNFFTQLINLWQRFKLSQDRFFYSTPSVSVATIQNPQTRAPINGVVDSIVNQGQEWRIRVHGVYWTAMATQPVEFNLGDRVQVIGRQNIKLIISSKQR